MEFFKLFFDENAIRPNRPMDDRFNNLVPETGNDAFSENFIRYFDKQLNDIMQMFAIPIDVPMFDGIDSTVPENFIPNSSNLREHYLKDPNEPKIDKDVDGEVNINELEKVLIPSNSPQRHGHFFSQSIITRTVVNPDGTVETKRTVRDHEGNEEVTTTYRKGSGEHSVIVKKDRNSNQHTAEEKHAFQTEQFNDANGSWLLNIFPWIGFK